MKPIRNTLVSSLFKNRIMLGNMLHVLNLCISILLPSYIIVFLLKNVKGGGQ